jgi:octanoyl-[GcvH]:protein N-octanoyltransferase
VRAIQLLTDPVPGAPALDTAVSRALLEAVGSGAAPETLRLYRPDDVLAFSGLDAASPGFAEAVAAARAAGFAPALRLAGGRAAVFHSETLAFAWAMPVAELRDGIQARFDALAELVAAALRRLGVDARVGEVPGEYCPGAHSVNARGRVKLMGVGQRVVRGAAHVGGVIVVGGSARVRAVLEPVYGALGLPFDPATAGAVEDEIGTVTREEVAAALLAELAARGFALAPAPPEAFPALLARASTLEARFRVPEPGAGAAGPAASASKTAFEPRDLSG